MTFDQGVKIRRNEADTGGGGYVVSGTVTLLNCFLQLNVARVAPGIAYEVGASVTLTNTPDQGMTQV